MSNANVKKWLRYAVYGVVIVAALYVGLNRRSAEPQEDTDTAGTAPEAVAVQVLPAGDAAPPAPAVEPLAPAPRIAEDGSYDSKDDVALYIYTYSRLPGNYITKSEAQKLGWNGGGLDEYAPGKSIGGDRFGNREGLLPVAKGRSYTECDIDTRGKKSRGAKRIVFSNDGLIYYTGDHYEHFELLYGAE